MSITIYDENVEWATSSSAGSFNFSDNSNPHTGLIDLDVLHANPGDSGTFTAPSPINSSYMGSLSLWVSPVAWALAAVVSIQWEDSNGNALGNAVSLQNGSYGFSNTTASYQNVVIPIGDFAIPAGSKVGKLAIAALPKTFMSFFVDTIVLNYQPCDPSTLASAAICFEQCIPDPAQVRSYLLCQYLTSCRAPLAPTGLALSAGANNPGSSTITVTWSQPLQPGGPTVTSFLIKWGTASGNYNVGSATVNSSTFSYTITGLNSSTTYFIVVEALATSCPSTNSNELQATTTGNLITLPQLGSLLVKLESLDFDGTAGGTVVGLWTNHGTGQNFNLTGASLDGNPAAPTVDAVNTLNGHNTIRFNNNNIIGTASFNFNGINGVEMMCVYKTDEPVVGDGNFFELMRISQALNTATPFTDGNFYESFGRTDRPNLGAPIHTLLTNFICYDISSLSNNTAYNAWTNTENFFTSGVYTFSNIQSANQTTIGGGYTGVVNLFASGNVAAVYAWNVSLSAAERLQARAYVKQTWGNGFGF